MESPWNCRDKLLSYCFVSYLLYCFISNHCDNFDNFSNNLIPCNRNKKKLLTLLQVPISTSNQSIPLPKSNVAARREVPKVQWDGLGEIGRCECYWSNEAELSFVTLRHGQTAVTHCHRLYSARKIKIVVIYINRARAQGAPTAKFRPVNPPGGVVGWWYLKGKLINATYQLFY